MKTLGKFLGSCAILAAVVGGSFQPEGEAAGESKSSVTPVSSVLVPGVRWFRIPELHPSKPDIAVERGKIVQQASVNLHGIGLSTLSVVEPKREVPQLILESKAIDEPVILTFDGSDPWSVDQHGEREGRNPILRFTVLAGPDSPQQFIAATVGYPSNGVPWYSSVILAVVKGKLEVVSKPLVLAGTGGIHLGNLDTKEGWGLAVWDYILVDGRHTPKKVQASFFKWNGSTFLMGRTVTAKGLYQYGDAPWSEVGVTFKDNVLSGAPDLIGI